MRPSPAAVALIATLAALAGCVDRTEKITLNPDGSGKSQIDLLIDPMAINMGGIAAARMGGPNAVRSIAQRVIRGCRGVDAWSDATCVVEDSGKVHFRGTAYFKDISKFIVSIGARLRYEWDKSPNGDMTLTITSLDAQPRPATWEPPASQPSDEQVKADLEKARIDLQRAKASMVRNYTTLKDKEVYVLPGKAENASILQPVANAPSEVQMEIVGKKILDGIDKMVTDDAAIKEAVAQGHLVNGRPDQDLQSQWVFGAKGKITVTASGQLKPLFDYATEAAAAKQAEPEMLQKLYAGASASKPALDGPLVPTPAK